MRRAWHVRSEDVLIETGRIYLQFRAWSRKMYADQSGPEYYRVMGMREIRSTSLYRFSEMNSVIRFLIKPVRGSAGTIRIRLAAGLIFFTQGIRQVTWKGRPNDGRRISHDD